MINDATSQLRPVTRICLLSFIIGSVSMKRLLPKDKLEEIVLKKPISILPRRRFLLLERQHMLLVFSVVSAFPAVLTVICSIIDPLNRVNFTHCLRI